MAPAGTAKVEVRIVCGNTDVGMGTVDIPLHASAAQDDQYALEITPDLSALNGDLAALLRKAANDLDGGAGPDRGGRVVIVKPGDVLLISNTGGPLEPEGMVEVFSMLKDYFGLAHVVAFEGDVDLTVLRTDDEAVDEAMGHIKHGLDYIREKYGKSGA